MSAYPGARLKARLAAGDSLLGMFVKTPAHSTVEILGRSGLDYLVLDAEHAPFSQKDLDICILAARASDVPALVRLQENSGTQVLQALDMGAAGVVVPHIDTAACAQRAVSSARYAGGARGFSPSARAGSYGQTTMAAHIQHSDAAATVVCQIESRQGVEASEAIAAVEGVDCLLIGRADLAVSLGADSVNAAIVNEAVEHVLAASRRAGCVSGIFLSDTSEAPALSQKGVRVFLTGSDQSLLSAGALDLRQRFESAIGS